MSAGTMDALARTLVALVIWVVLIALAWGLVRVSDDPADDERTEEGRP